MSETKLDLQRLGHGWWGRTGKSQLDLHTIIDEPLQSSQGTDHENPGSKTGPHTSETKVLSGRANSGALGLVHVGDDGVGGMRHNGAEDTSNVTSGKGDHQLLALGAISTRLGHNIGVQSLDGLLEAGELHHGVRNLTSPQGHKRLVESIDAFSSIDLRGSSTEGGGEGAGGRSLHPNLAALHGRQSNVSEELSAGRRDQVQASSPEESILLSHHVTISALEHLVESKLAETLSGVSNEGGSPAKEETLGTGISHGDLEAITERLVILLVHLK